MANDLKFAIVIARFNDLVTKLLLEGALEAFDRHGGDRDAVDVSSLQAKVTKYSPCPHTEHIIYRFPPPSSDCSICVL